MTAKAHGGNIDIQGVTVATVDDKVRLQNVQTWFDPMEMFRQIAPNGIVNKQIVTPEDKQEASEEEHKPSTAAEAATSTATSAPTTISTTETENLAQNLNIRAEDQVDTVTASGNSLDDKVEAAQRPTSAPGNGIVDPAEGSETTAAHEEMSKITPAQCPFMNKE